MARKCDICGKGRMSGNNVSHAKNRNKRAWLPNVRKVKMEENGNLVSKKVCSKCLRNMNKI
ncbi:MAG: 50S ribosomal protein L28 [Candidatus Woesearchaeota archaeon]